MLILCRVLLPLGVLSLPYEKMAAFAHHGRRLICSASASGLAPAPMPDGDDHRLGGGALVKIICYGLAGVLICSRGGTAGGLSSRGGLPPASRNCLFLEVKNKMPASAPLRAVRPSAEDRWRLPRTSASAPGYTRSAGHYRRRMPGSVGSISYPNCTSVLPPVTSLAITAVHLPLLQAIAVEMSPRSPVNGATTMDAVSSPALNLLSSNGTLSSALM